MSLADRLAARESELRQAVEMANGWAQKVQMLNGAVLELRAQIEEEAQPPAPDLSRHRVVAEVARLQKRAERRDRKRRVA